MRWAEAQITGSMLNNIMYNRFISAAKLRKTNKLAKVFSLNWTKVELYRLLEQNKSK